MESAALSIWVMACFICSTASAAAVFFCSSAKASNCADICACIRSIWAKTLFSSWVFSLIWSAARSSMAWATSISTREDMVASGLICWATWRTSSRTGVR